MMTDADIDALIAKGDYTAAAYACAELVDPIAYRQAMERCFEARKRAPFSASHVSPLTTTTKGNRVQFELSNQESKLTSFNPRAELHGEEPEPAADISFTLNLPSEQLAMFAPTLRGMLYCKKDASEDSDLANQASRASAEPNLRFPKLGALSWSEELVGATLTIDHGLGGKKSDIVLQGCTVKKFKIDAQEGGTCILSFQVQGHPGERECGKLSMLVGRDIEITIEPPKGDLVEQAQTPDKPLATAGDAERTSTRSKRRAAADEAFH